MIKLDQLPISSFSSSYLLDCRLQIDNYQCMVLAVLH